MSEAALKHDDLPVIEPAETTVAELALAVPSGSDEGDNDNCTVQRRGERIGFQLPGRIWGAMFACYAVFFVSIIAALGGTGPARFVLVVAVLFALMYFGMGRIMVRQSGTQPRSPIDRSGGFLQTCYGALSDKEVSAQILTVPFAVAIFGVAILIVKMAVFS